MADIKDENISTKQLEKIISKVVSREVQKAFSEQQSQQIELAKKPFQGFIKPIISFIKICLTSVIDKIVNTWFLF